MAAGRVFQRVPFAAWGWLDLAVTGAAHDELIIDQIQDDTVGLKGP